MRGRFVLAGLGFVIGGAGLFAQIPPPISPPSFPPANSLPPAISPQFPRSPAPPSLPLAPVPPSGGLPAPGSPADPAPKGAAVPPLQLEVPLPYAEEKLPLDAGTVTLKRVNNSWQVWAGPRLLKDLGDQEESAKDVVRALRELRPTEWVGIGGPRPIVEYGLINNRPPTTAGFPRAVVPIDLKTVRVEPVKGVFVLRDDENILFNFGLKKADADQALGVVRKYGFNRVGMVGLPAPVMTYFFVYPEADQAPRQPNNTLHAALQENALTRTGIPIPGVGFVGEMIKIDPRKVEVRREGSEWVVAFGSDVLGHFGGNEWGARDGLKLIQDAKFTEFCRVGAGLTFFLVNGKAPTRVPLAVQGRRYNLAELKVRPLAADRWAVTEAGRHLFDVASPEEGEAIIRLLGYYQFDQVCQMGPSPRTGLSFLAKSR